MAQDPENPLKTPIPQTDEGMPPIDFTTFILSLASATMIDLGEMEGPDGLRHPNLPMARHHVDILAMLQEKTRGNLSGEEERLLHQLLYDLRMRFIHLAEKVKP